MASPAGFEPTAPGLGILCSILLSYGDRSASVDADGAAPPIRPSSLPLASPSVRTLPIPTQFARA